MLGNINLQHKVNNKLKITCRDNLQKIKVSSFSSVKRQKYLKLLHDHQLMKVWQL